MNIHNDSYNLKLIAVGDGAIGKTSLFMSYVNRTFDQTYIPTVFDIYNTKVNKLDYYPKYGQSLNVNLTLNDTAGQEDFDRLRLLSYSGTDVVLICFSIVNPTSFRNIIDKWFPEIKEFCPKAKIILVGTKIDLKHDTSIINNLKRNGQVPIDSSKAEKLCKDMQAFKYIETSAKTRENVRLVFEEAIRSCLKPFYDETSSKACFNSKKCALL